MTDIRPALTAEEWAEGRMNPPLGKLNSWVEARVSVPGWSGYRDLVLTGDAISKKNGVIVGSEAIHGLIALANHTMPDDDQRKIVRTDVEACRSGRIACAGERDAARKDGRTSDAREWEKAAHTLDRLLSKLNALLPPED